MLTKSMWELAVLNGVQDRVRGDEVNYRIRKEYSQSEENAILRKMIQNPDDEKVRDDFNRFNKFVEDTINEVDILIMEFEI